MQNWMEIRSNLSSPVRFTWKRVVISLDDRPSLEAYYGRRSDGLQVIRRTFVGLLIAMITIE